MEALLSLILYVVCVLPLRCSAASGCCVKDFFSTSFKDIVLFTLLFSSYTTHIGVLVDQLRWLLVVEFDAIIAVWTNCERPKRKPSYRVYKLFCEFSC
jgi:hypothetical protein